MNPEIKIKGLSRPSRYAARFPEDVSLDMVVAPEFLAVRLVAEEKSSDRRSLHVRYKWGEKLGLTSPDRLEGEFGDFYQSLFADSPLDNLDFYDTTDAETQIRNNEGGDQMKVCFFNYDERGQILIDPANRRQPQSKIFYGLPISEIQKVLAKAEQRFRDNTKTEMQFVFEQPQINSLKRLIGSYVANPAYSREDLVLTQEGDNPKDADILVQLCNGYLDEAPSQEMDIFLSKLRRENDFSGIKDLVFPSQLGPITVRMNREEFFRQTRSLKNKRKLNPSVF